MTSLYIFFSPFMSRSLHIHSNASKNIYATILVNGLVMVTNEGLNTS